MADQATLQLEGSMTETWHNVLKAITSDIGFIKLKHIDTVTPRRTAASLSVTA